VLEIVQLFFIEASKK